MNTLPSLLPLRIYYEDTDFSGFVYHARYLHFFERGRTEALRHVGIDQRALFEAEGGPQSFVVRHMAIDFKNPARMDDMVAVETRITEVGGATIKMRQTLKRGDDVLASAEVLASADVTIAFLTNGKPKRLPQAMRDKLAALR